MRKSRLSQLYQEVFHCHTPFNPRRGQIKMFETVAVLVVFFFLLITGVVFYFGAQTTALENEQAKANEKRGLQIALKALYMPELDCSFLATQKDNCIDKIKLQKLSALIADEEPGDYFDIFGYATITVKEIYPSFNSTILYENIQDKYSNKIPTQSPILLYDSWKDEYAFGVIEVFVYVE